MPDKQTKKQTNHQGGKFEKGNNIGNRFKPGESGNKKGRPKKGEAFTDIIRKIGETKKNNKTRKERIIEKAYSMAEEGDIRAIQFLVERLDGKPIQTNLVAEVDSDELVEI